jgi:hypothetical protein
MKYFLILIFFSLFITSCNHKERAKENISKDGDFVSKNSDYPGDSLYFSLMNSIHNDTSLFLASSLNYSSKFGSTLKGMALVDENNIIHQLTSIENDTINETIFDFYYLNSKKRISTELICDYQKDSNYYHQIISFYDTSGACIYTGFKYFEDLNLSSETTYLKADFLREMDDQTAVNIIQQQGSFETNFRGFIALEAYNLEYIEVGANDGFYSSMLAISDENTEIMKLKNNIEKYKGKPLRVEFTKVIRADGFSYQLLLNIRFNP